MEMGTKDEFMINYPNSFDVFDEQDIRKKQKREIKVSTKIILRTVLSSIVYFSITFFLQNSIVPYLFAMIFSIQIIMTFFILTKNQYYLFLYERKYSNNSKQSYKVLSHIYQVVYWEVFEFTVYLLLYFVLLEVF